MKTLFALMLMVIVCSCNKQIDTKVPAKQLDFTIFSSMLSKEKTYIISGYYKGEQTLDIPEVNREDTYTFDGVVNDGWVSSKEPCIEYHYNFKAFASDESIVLEWINFQISPQTYTVSDYKIDEWFVLKSGDTYTKYEVKQQQ